MSGVLGVAALILLVILGYQGSQISQLENQVSSLGDYIDSQDNQLNLLESQLDMMNEIYETNLENGGLWFWDAMSYPATPEQLLQSLNGNEKLIPFEGVLGGSMYFVTSEAKILDSKYVYVPIEDGHMLGGMLLKYEFLNNKQIEWQVVDGWWPK